MKNKPKRPRTTSRWRQVSPLLVLFSGVGVAHAGTIAVVNTNDAGPGSLRQAIADAVAGDTIVFDADVFSSPQTITLGSGELVIDKSLTLQGPGAALLTVSGGNVSRVFRIPSVAGATTCTVAATLDGLSVTNGNGVGGGSAGSGGAVINGCALTISNSVIANSATAGLGGGIANEGTLNLTRTVVSRNSAGLGGGLSSLAGTVTIDNSTISDNAATLQGGGIFVQGIVGGGVATALTHTTLSGNQAGQLGGGIANFIGTLAVANTTVSGNSTAGSFGGLVSIGPTTVVGSTVTGNRSDSDGDGNGMGGGIGASPLQSTDVIQVDNTIVAGNVRGAGATVVSDDVQGIVGVARNNLVADAATSAGIADGVGGNIVGLGGTGTRDVHSILDTTLADNGGPTRTHALVPDSPAIDAGDDALSGGLETDQRGLGFPRIAGAVVDIGAYELQRQYDFAGFFPPVDNLPTLNVAKAGSAIPIKFSLNGDRGLGILAAGYPASGTVDCGSTTVGSITGELASDSGSSLEYDPVSRQYRYVWKTDRAWMDTCRLLVVRLYDGSEHYAAFQLR